MSLAHDTCGHHTLHCADHRRKVGVGVCYLARLGDITLQLVDIPTLVISILGNDVRADTSVVAMVIERD